jgi:hypothetical protein
LLCSTSRITSDSRTRRFCTHRTGDYRDAARERGEVYALVSPTRPRELRYPRWQFDAPAGRLAAALRPFVHARKNCFVIHHFMLHVQTTASGPTSMQIILDTNANIDALIQLAIGYMHADQGAS